MSQDSYDLQQEIFRNTKSRPESMDKKEMYDFYENKENYVPLTVSKCARHIHNKKVKTYLSGEIIL